MKVRYMYMPPRRLHLLNVWPFLKDKIQALQLTVRLRKSREYAYTVDFVSAWTSGWEKHLAHLKNRPGIQMIEVGSFEGRSAIWFAQNIFTHTTARVHCVDVFSRRCQRMRFDHNVEVSRCSERIECYVGESDFVLTTFGAESVDVCYIDGAHRAMNVLMDALLAFETLKPGGIMIFDDYLWRMDLPVHYRTQLGIDLFVKAMGDKCTVLEKGAQIVVRKL